MNRQSREAAERQVRQRFIILNALRFSGIVMVMFGFAIVRGLIDLPWALGAGLAVIGMLEFFFLPRFIARSWNAGDGSRK